MITDMETKNITVEQMRELVAQEKWVKTPYRYTQLGAGLSLIQQQALLMVSHYLQSYIKDFYNLHLDRSKRRPKALFSEHVLRNGIPPMKIYLADLGVLPSNYGAARQAIEQINLMVEHPELDANGNETGRTLLTNVFSQFGFEETGEYYNFGEPDADGKRQSVRMKQPWIDVKINPDVAEWAFDMSQGYVNHLELIASYSTKRPTPRLYLMLMNRTKKGEKEVTILLTDLKEYLGIMPYKDERTGEMIVPYPKFANFRQKVLDAVKDDLDRMAGENHTDITFTYELIYPGTRRKGDPEAILFHVTRTVLGDAYNVVVNHKPSELIRKPVQQELFAASDAGTEPKPKVQDFVAGEGADRWAQLLSDYDGPAKSLLLRARYLGLRGGSFYVSISKADDAQWDALGREWERVYAVARPLLSIPRLAPAIVKTIN